jgi:parallel beta-helix repeat protein
MLMNSWFNEIWDNTIKFCDKGIRLIYDIWGEEGGGSWENNVHHNTINLCGLFGIEIHQSNNNSISYNDIKNTADFGITVVLSDDNFVDHNNIVDNRIGVVVADCIADLRNNWWGSPSGPGGIGSGSGDIIQLTNGTVFFDPWLTSPASKNLQFNQGISSSSLFSFLDRYPLINLLFQRINIL